MRRRPLLRGFFVAGLLLAGLLEAGCDCVEAHSEYFGKEPGVRCCPGLKNVNRMFGPNPDGTTMDGFPPGCGYAVVAPPDLMVCLPCGDGECGDEENFCNCEEDCPRE